MIGTIVPTNITDWTNHISFSLKFNSTIASEDDVGTSIRWWIRICSSEDGLIQIDEMDKGDPAAFRSNKDYYGFTIWR